MNRIYLDHNATTRILPEALEAMTAAAAQGGNASSIHQEGRAARQLIETARGHVAALLGDSPLNVIFTGSGTEANNLALSPGLHLEKSSGPATYLLISGVDHAAVLNGHRFPDGAFNIIPVLNSGEIDIDGVKAKLTELNAAGENVLVSVMLANNETGIIQPIQAVSEMVHEIQGIMHTDAVQAAGKIPLNMSELGVDLMSLSGHKIGATPGVGALIVRGDIIALPKLIGGGGQERRRRAGTENIPGIAAFGVAARTAKEHLEVESNIGALRDRLEAGIMDISPEATIFGRDMERLANTTYFALRDFSAETLVIAFDLAGIALSSGSACTSGKVEASHVLIAMGVDQQLASCAIRVSLGHETTMEEVDKFLEVWSRIYRNIGNREKNLETKTSDSGRAA